MSQPEIRSLEDTLSFSGPAPPALDSHLPKCGEDGGAGSLWGPMPLGLPTATAPDLGHSAGSAGDTPGERRWRWCGGQPSGWAARGVRVESEQVMAESQGIGSRHRMTAERNDSTIGHEDGSLAVRPRY